MPHGEEPEPKPISWKVYKIANKAAWLGEVEAPAEIAAIEKAAAKFKVPASRPMADFFLGPGRRWGRPDVVQEACKRKHNPTVNLPFSNAGDALVTTTTMETCTKSKRDPK